MWWGVKKICELDLLIDGRFKSMGEPKKGVSSKGKEMHYAVGAVIKRDGKYLLIDRVNVPLGFAGIAGHVDEGESVVDALVREVREESGLKVVGHELVFEEEVEQNECKRGVGVHYWCVFECDVEGEVKRNLEETKSIGWFGGGGDWRVGT